METITTKNDTVTMRRLGPADEAAIERLTQLDSARRPSGPMIGAEVEGRLLAARSLETGETIADPFSRTGELRRILGVRARQLSRRESGGLGRRSMSALAPLAQLRTR